MAWFSPCLQMLPLLALSTVGGVGGCAVAVGVRWPSHLLLDQAPDAILDRVEARYALDAELTRPLDPGRDDILDPAGTAREDHHTVGQVYGLVDLVGDE